MNIMNNIAILRSGNMQKALDLRLYIWEMWEVVALCKPSFCKYRAVGSGKSSATEAKTHPISAQIALLQYFLDINFALW